MQSPEMHVDSLISCVNASLQERPPVAWRKNHFSLCHRAPAGAPRRLPDIRPLGEWVENTQERKEEERTCLSLGN